MPSHIALLAMPRLGTVPGPEHGDLRVTFLSVDRQRDFDTVPRPISICATAMANGLAAGHTCCTARFWHQLQRLPKLLPGHGKNWRDGPVIDLSGPRSGWRAWSAATGTPAPSRSVLQFDSFDLVLSAALQDLGVILASLPLCAATALADGRLVRLPEQQVEIDAGYWLSWN